MLRFTYCVVTCLLLFSLFISFERTAYAYVDPGSGLFLLQGISTAVVGALYYIRRRLKSMMGSRTEASSGQTE